MRIICDLNKFTSPPTNSACCLLDWDLHSAGGYCVRYNGSGGDTYYMTESQFADAITQSAISSNYKINDTADNDIGFEIFNCVVSALVMTCDKFQMRPASSYSGGFLFESGYLAKGLTFDSAKASTKWIDRLLRSKVEANSSFLLRWLS